MSYTLKERIQQAASALNTAAEHLEYIQTHTVQDDISHGTDEALMEDIMVCAKRVAGMSRNGQNQLHIVLKTIKAPE